MHSVDIGVEATSLALVSLILLLFLLVLQLTKLAQLHLIVTLLQAALRGFLQVFVHVADL